MTEVASYVCDITGGTFNSLNNLVEYPVVIPRQGQPEVVEVVHSIKGKKPHDLPEQTTYKDVMIIVDDDGNVMGYMVVDGQLGEESTHSIDNVTEAVRTYLTDITSGGVL